MDAQTTRNAGIPILFPQYDSLLNLCSTPYRKYLNNRIYVIGCSERRRGWICYQQPSRATTQKHHLISKITWLINRQHIFYQNPVFPVPDYTKITHRI